MNLENRIVNSIFEMKNALRINKKLKWFDSFEFMTIDKFNIWDFK